MPSGSIITNAGKRIIMNRAYNDDGATAYTAPSVFSIGIMNSTPKLTDTGLARPVPISGSETVDDCEAITNWSSGTDSAISLNTTTFKIGSGALNIYKTGSSGAVFSASKTVTSLDFTNKELSVWVYIADTDYLVSTGTAIIIHYGSDSSNYYVFNIDATSLSDGWNLIVKSSADANSTEGTPTISACDYFAIFFNTELSTDTVAEGSVVIDDIKLVGAGNYKKAYVTGYPSIDENNNEVETQMFLSSVEANGYDINSIGMFNTDSSPIMFAVDTFLGESKSNTDELVFVVKDRFI